MMRRHLITLLVLVNLMLIAGIVLQSREEQPTGGGGIEIVTQRQTNTIPVTNTVIGTNTPSGKLKWPPFRWSEIETNDYLQLTENLIRIGCPRQTIRDLVLARIRDDYADQEWTTARPIQDHVWDVVAKGLSMNDWNVPPTIEESMKELSANRQAVLELVETQIGEAPEIPTLENSYRWRFLNDEDFKMVKEIHLNYEKLRDEFQRRIEASEDILAVKELTAQKKELGTALINKLKALLGEEKWSEYLLRRNRNSEWTHSLVGTGLTAEEVRAVTEARRITDNAPLSADLTDAEQRTARHRAAEAVTEKILKPERVAEIERSNDSDYRTWQKIGRRLNLPPDVANRAYEYKQIALEHAKEIATNRLLNEENRKLAYIALQLEVSNGISGIYGEAWPIYEKYGADWIVDLADAE
jgi:hypothetical protein